MIRYLTADEIRDIAVAVTRTQSIVRDEDLLASAAGRPQHAFGGRDLYPDVWAKAAALIEGVARNHALVDGNKRTAWMCGWMFLSANSNHSGGVNCVMTDGSVRFVSETVDCGSLSGTHKPREYFSKASPFGVWGALGTISGGETKSL